MITLRISSSNLDSGIEKLSRQNIYHHFQRNITDQTFFETVGFLFHVTDVSSASSLKCEVRDSCSPSRECQYTNQMTVDPGSNVSLNCSIMNGGAARRMTWKQVQQRVNSTAGLVLQQVNSSNEMHPCLCTRIYFTRGYFLPTTDFSSYIL